MKKCLFLLIALAAVGSAAAQSRVEEFRVQSEKLGCEKICSVYLPDGYDKSDKVYPVLYLLHGASDNYQDWAGKGNMRQIVDDAIAEGTALEMIVVMPDAAGEGERRIGKHMGYFDMPGWNYEQFFFGEFIPAVEKHYRIAGTKARRAISGLSMGGGGTAVYALHRPDMFGSACTMSGLLDVFPSPRSYDAAVLESIANNSPVRLLRELTDEQIAQQRSVRWWVDCGDDDFLYESNIRFYELMRHHTIPIQFRMRNGGHSWRYWQQALPSILTFVSIGFAE